MQLGQYEVIRSLGKGSFGEVFLARTLTATGFQKTVAIKRLRDAVADDTELIERFAIEARICGHLNHPNIIQVYNFIESSDGFLLVMEHLHGLELRQILTKFRKERRILPPAQTVSLIRQLCEGLHFAHVASSDDGKPLGLVHRDIKPSNLMITAQSTLKIMDFGVARADFARTRSGIKSVKGTLQYMAPEQVVGGAIDATVDQYATGLILAEMLIGYPVYHADSENQLFFMVGTGAVEPALEVLRVHHPVLHPIVQRALALAPGARFSSLDEMTKALAEVERFLPPSVGPGVFCTALLEGTTPVADLGIKPAWPLRQRESNRERERLAALAQNLGMAVPESAEPGSSLTDPGLLLEPISLQESSSLDSQRESSSLEGTLPTGVMPAELARLVDPLAALWESSSLVPPGQGPVRPVGVAEQFPLPPPVPEEDPDTELISSPQQPLVGAEPPQKGDIPLRSLEGIVSESTQARGDVAIRSGFVVQAPQVDSGSISREWRTWSGWIWGGISALTVLLIGLSALLLMRPSAPDVRNETAAGVSTAAVPSSAELEVAARPHEPADASVSASGPTPIPAPAPLSASPNQGQSAPAAGEVLDVQKAPQTPGDVPTGERVSLSGPSANPLAVHVLARTPGPVAQTRESRPNEVQPVPRPEEVARKPASVSSSAGASVSNSAGASVSSSAGASVSSSAGASVSKSPVVADAAAAKQAPQNGAASEDKTSKVILRVLPRAAAVVDEQTGQSLECFWGCALSPGTHSLRVVGADGQGVSLPLEVPSGRSLQCAFQLGRDTRWKCQ